jgi:HK97 family phage major capsid protein
MDASEIKGIEDVKSAFLSQHHELKSFIEKANNEIKDAGSVSAETKAAVDKISTTANELADRIGKLEAKASRSVDLSGERKSLGRAFSESNEYKALRAGSTKSARMDVKAITNVMPPSNDAPLVAADRLPGMITPPTRRLTIRDLLASGVTSSNLVEFAKENVFTDNAGPQVGASPTVQAENVTKPESDITFTLASVPVVTLSHFILASRQVLDDSPMLESYINTRLLYGLKLEEETQLLNGSGAFGNISGLNTNRTAYNRHVAGDTKIDTLRRAITQLQLSEFQAEAIIINPAQWEQIELQKDDEKNYVFASVIQAVGPTLWGLPVVATNSMPNNQFLVANLSQAAQVWDRMQATVELSREDDTNFRKNMVTILAEERIALAVYRSSALIGGNFPQTP